MPLAVVKKKTSALFTGSSTTDSAANCTRAKLTSKTCAKVKTIPKPAVSLPCAEETRARRTKKLPQQDIIVHQKSLTSENRNHSQITAK